MSNYTIPRLTTVEQPVDDIARESVQILIDMLENNEPPRHVVVDAKFKARDSVCRPGISHR